MTTPLLDRPAPIVDDATRRDVLKGLGVLGAGWALAGCSDDGQPAEPQPPANRTISDGVGGEVEIPVRPRRIVVLDDTVAPQLFALGATEAVIGMPTVFGSEFRDEYQQKYELSGISKIGPLFQPDLERIAELRPDLLVDVSAEGQSLFDPSLRQQLGRLAPMVALPLDADIEGATAATVELLGEAATVDPQSLRADYEKSVAELRAVLGARWSETTVSLIDYRAGSFTRAISTPGTWADPFARLGVPFVPLVDQATAEGGGLEVSGERFGEFNADLMILVTAFSDGNRAPDEPTFTRLPVVTAGQVIEINYSVPVTYPDVADYTRDLSDRLTALGDIRTDLVA